MPESSRVMKALKKIQLFLDAEKREQLKRREQIRDKAKILKKRIKAIKRKLQAELSDDSRMKLEDELNLIKAKRRKAIEILKQIRKDRG
ncbi:MAG: hypothetical protein MI864_02990 [Pseudomonadales bacterium]|nr:hypothetical protein [Pseudomonadales bacterium]